jgi:hypothetical protein
MKQMSYVNAINEVLNGNINDEVVERLTALRDSIAKRNSSKAGKPTKAQIANAEIGESVVSAMESGVDYTIADIKGLVPALADANPQKVSPIMRKLTADGKVEAIKVKGKVAYHLA